MSNTAFCEQCQGPIEASDRYCPNCGQTQVTVDERAEPVGAAPDAPVAPPIPQPDPVTATPHMQGPQVSGDTPPTPPPAPGQQGQAGGRPQWSISLESFSREEQILAGIALLLAIDLLLLPWFEIGVESFSFSTTATQNPDGWLGVLAGLAAVALIADLAIERLSPHIHLPSLAPGHAATRLLLASAAAGCVALKFLFHIHFSLFGAGFWLAAALSIALVVFASRLRHSPATVGPRPPSSGVNTGTSAEHSGKT